MKKAVSLFVMGVIVLGAFVPTSASALTVSEQVASLLEQIRSLQVQITSLRSQAVALRVSSSTSPTPPSTPVGCVIPPIPTSTSTSSYHDGKIKIVSTNRSYVYKDGKRHVVITPNSYIEENGKLKITITPKYRIDKDGKKKTVISCTGTPADANAPTLSLVGATLTDTSANIVWTTNEAATGKVYYSTTSPATTAPSVVNTTLTNSHSIVLTGLSASTTYYYVVESKDAAGNTATSSVQHFTTLVTPDTTTPVISSVSVGLIASSSAQVAWATNESATSKVYFGTTPFLLASAFSTSDSALVTAHMLPLTGLSASTTYSVVIESKDGAGNTSTSSPLLFTTGN